MTDDELIEMAEKWLDRLRPCDLGATGAMLTTKLVSRLKAQRPEVDALDAARWRMAINLPQWENEIFYGGDFNTATLQNAVHSAMKRDEPQGER